MTRGRGRHSAHYQRGQQMRTHAAATLERPPAARRVFPKLWLAVGAVVAVLVIGGAVWLVAQNSSPLPSIEYPSQGNTHLNPGDPHPVYNSDPPTSGWHYSVPSQRGIYTTPLPEESLVHFMEHAGVVVHYNPDVLPPDQLAQLTAIVKSELNQGQGMVLLAPDPLAPQAVALTAWRRLQTFTTVAGNKTKIEDFIERLECHYDPEGICGPPHGTTFQVTGTPAPGVPTVIAPPLAPNASAGTPMR